MKKAIFPGTFDPFHDGHMHVVKESIKVFDKLFILISSSASKKPASLSKRVKFVQSLVSGLNKVEVIWFEKTRLTSDVAKELNCTAIVRGIRNSEDLKYEMDMRKAYESLNPEIAYIIFLATDKNKQISSSLMKEIKDLKEK